MTYFDRERDDALAQDAMSQGEYMSCALGQYAAAYGSEDPQREWVLSPYDTWHKNPFFTGTPGRHPEDDYDEPQVEAPTFIATTPASVLDAHWDDEVPF